jgi:nucleoside phosphorylase
MRILVALAIEAEFTPWRRFGDIHLCRVEAKKRPAASSSPDGHPRALGSIIATAKIRGARVDFLLTGMGASNARCAIRDALAGIETAASNYQLCIASGLSGALAPTIALAEVVVPESVASIATTQTNASTPASVPIACDPALLRQAVMAGARQVKTQLTVDHVVCSVAEKSSLAPKADIIDMETYEILAAAAAHKIPALAIRGISDCACDELPTGMEALVDQFGHAKPVAALKMLATRPGTIGPLMRLGRASKDAAAKLAQFVRSYIEQISLQDQALTDPSAHGKQSNHKKRDLQHTSAP